MTFPEQFRAALIAKGIPQVAFAKEVGAAQGFVSMIANGKRPPSIDALPRWADVLDLDGAARNRFLEAGELAIARAKKGANPAIDRLEKLLAASLARESALRAKLRALQGSE